MIRQRNEWNRKEREMKLEKGIFESLCSQNWESSHFARFTTHWFRTFQTSIVKILLWISMSNLHLRQGMTHCESKRGKTWSWRLNILYCYAHLIIDSVTSWMCSIIVGNQINKMIERNNMVQDRFIEVIVKHRKVTKRISNLRLRNLG
jgi:hypothetical protein